MHIVDDHILEGTQSFTLKLEVPNASQQLGVDLGEYQEVQVDIEDNDSEYITKTTQQVHMYIHTVHNMISYCDTYQSHLIINDLV